MDLTITSENGSKSYSVVRIKDVYSYKGVLNIEGTDQREDDQHKTTLAYRLAFYHDSLNWSVDAINLLQCPVAYSSNFFFDLSSDSLVYPYNMKVGDTLPPASAMEVIRATTSNTRSIAIVNRKVVGTEIMDWPNSKPTAYKIESTQINVSIADYGALGKIPSETKSARTDWFVPSSGIVRTEVKTSTGVTVTSYRPPAK
jgi:hypothetical protein